MPRHSSMLTLIHQAPAVPKIRCREIGAADLAGVVDLLVRGFPHRPRGFWLRALGRLAKHAMVAGLPKYGYLMDSDGVPVGVILMIFSRIGAGLASSIRCNVSSWYVEPAFRSYASALVARALRHKDVTYLNITPAPHTRVTVEAQGFARYCNGIFVALPTLSTPSAPAPATILQAHARPDALFDPGEHDLLLDHAAYGCTSLWCVSGERAYPFVFRPRRVKAMVVCTQLIYSASVETFVRFARPLGRYFALRGRPLVIIDANAPIPGLVGKYLDGRMPKYFKGPDRPRVGDLAYTEAAMFGV
jgi:hypothetical protein